ncbi:hypothetical protein PoB_000960600 [Plakobranchus ocellatus]|uniref:Uncharacterized protein n=1 Tax=Plakobranchus ocellatus TaxID=259542 RepID=A0AAV3YIN8_9GAST|nr:hypothetical protein PoB_000960600 [Plakobranchus ocellatus]
MLQKPLRKLKQYHAVAAVDRETLAVGHWNGVGIDLINRGGRVLRHICSNVHPRFMDITDDGKLVCSTAYGAIARVQIDTGSVDFNESVLQIEFPRGVATTFDGSILVTDGSSNMLHLVLSQDDSTKQLWSVPSDRDHGDPLRSASADGNVCVCVTVHGSVYILDCLY